MVKEFVLIERGEYDRLKDNLSSNQNEIVSDTTPGSSMLSTSHLLSAVKNKVGIMYHNKVKQLFEFLKAHPSLCRYQFDRLPSPPGHPGAFAPKCVPSPRAFAQQKMPGGPANK